MSLGYRRMKALLLQAADPEGAHDALKKLEWVSEQVRKVDPDGVMVMEKPKRKSETRLQRMMRERRERSEW